MVTLFGDSIAPRSSGLWLGELIQLLRPFHMNERLVRTSTFRLAEEGWLEPQRQGRRSRYSLTTSGVQRIAERASAHLRPSAAALGWTVDGGGAEPSPETMRAIARSCAANWSGRDLERWLPALLCIRARIGWR